MVLVTLPTIENDIGMKPYDLRPMGYSVEEGQEMMTLMSDDIIDFYQRIQLPLDFIYPLFLSLLLFEMWKRIDVRTLKKFAGLAFAIMLFDYLENIMIYFILNGGEELFIQLASIFGVLKAISTTVIASFVIGCLLYKGARNGIQNRKEGQTES
jgi:hypothetical protein